MGKKKNKKHQQQSQVKPQTIAKPVTNYKVMAVDTTNEHPECTHNNGVHCKLGTTCKGVCKAFHGK